ncbi:MAG: cellulase family glycosylhydrolase [Candidatus Poribacteria bacterium]|nr:cellulase family glycosylhydrolase [Candidatus Poribacteria bacterium]
MNQHLFFLSFLTGPLLFGCTKVLPDNQKDRTRINAPVFKKLHKGVNIDTSVPQNGVWFKVQHDAAHFRAAADAGFQSVRVFMPYYGDIKSMEAQIVEALDNDLAIVVCMWGLNSWSQKDISVAIEQIAKRWRHLARLWKRYPGDLVFEVLNEPEGIGFKGKQAHKKAMKLYNAAVQAIREEDANRPILIGCPGYNDSIYLDPYVTEEHLTYTFGDGQGFYDDTSTGVAIHFYRPQHKDGVNFAMWTMSLEGEVWKPSILREITNASKWRERIDVNIPIITSEWGCWLFPRRSDKDLNEWLDYHMSLFKAHSIGNMWYTGILNNQASFAIYDTELGWNQKVLDKLTGVKPTLLPKTSQVINGEFFRPDSAWSLTTDKITKEYIHGSESLNGTSMLKLSVPEGVEGQLYQQTVVDEKQKSPPGRTLLHLINGQTYRISFMAMSVGGKGRMKIMLRDARSMDLIYDSHDTDKGWIVIGSEPSTITRLYMHNADDEMDVRLELDVGSQKQVLFIDKVEFVRN